MKGVNIPQIQKAFILASTTVERQWIQRRGRLLRKCDEIGKKPCRDSRLSSPHRLI